jgi:hypothetical protein
MRNCGFSGCMAGMVLRDFRIRVTEMSRKKRPIWRPLPPYTDRLLRDQVFQVGPWKQATRRREWIYLMSTSANLVVGLGAGTPDRLSP